MTSWTRARQSRWPPWSPWTTSSGGGTGQRASQLRFKLCQGLFKTFRFGNGTTQVSESFVLLSQKLWGYQVSLGLYTIDSTGVPLLIGIRTLEKLGAVVDCARGAMVLKTIDDSLVVPLKRSQAGHLLLDMVTQDWLEGGARILFTDRLGADTGVKKSVAANLSEPNAVHVEGSAFVVFESESACSGVDVAHALSEAEWSQLPNVPAECVGEWLADVFTVRVTRADEETYASNAEAKPQGDTMSLRALSFLATAPFLLAASSTGHVDCARRSHDTQRYEHHEPYGNLSQGQGQDLGQQEEVHSEGYLGGEVRQLPNPGRRSTRSSLYGASLSGIPQAEGLSKPGSLFNHVHSMQAAPRLHPAVRSSRGISFGGTSGRGHAEAAGGDGHRGAVLRTPSGQDDCLGWSRKKLPDSPREDPRAEGEDGSPRRGAQVRNEASYNEDRGDKFGGTSGGWRPHYASTPKLEDTQGRGDPRAPGPSSGLSSRVGGFMASCRRSRS